jgi:hypothetical protein
VVMVYMGCDIHFHSEVKINGAWHHYSSHKISRDYWLFSILAGVRNYCGVVPISMPRGLPSDISPVTSLDRQIWGSDGHSDSFITSSEIPLVEKRWLSREDSRGGIRQVGTCFGTDWADFHDRIDFDGHRKNIEDVRWVFWFDN